MRRLVLLVLALFAGLGASAGLNGTSGLNATSGLTAGSGVGILSTCSPTSACKEGCCNQFGSCGFGPNYCGADACISDCHRKSECNPGYGAEWSERDKCPLNVCCSEHGYCGYTEAFCGNKTVEHKTCSKKSGNARVIGYFEGWARNRPCNVFWPEQIPVGLYTHINFAFATIDPTTFKVAPVSESDENLYNRLMLLKRRDPDLQVFVAIGGWTFNDPGPTATTFSDIAASVPRQRTFIESLMSFMSTYGFDGVDLDWEYPGAKDRSGRDVDYENFPKFMARLSDSLKPAKKGISITIPASYWYLQHFDLQALAKSIDWFNVMSYDLHGTWDKGNAWTGSFLNSHTNLTEIDQALDLIWRNDIDPGMVVMGLGFYGRAFTASSSACMTPGCTFVSGGEKGKCSREIGILLNSEIDDLVKQHGVTPVLYEKEASKVAAWGDQWVSYDDEETFKLKSEYAQSMCLGGLMVWAISHDTADAKYNMALARVANRRIVSALPALNESDSSTRTFTKQCKWVNCGEACPTGWVHMKREDPGARGTEYMLDGQGCGGLGTHAFCCPPNDKLPKCGWYTHNNGKCNPACPTGYGAVGGNNQYCNNGLSQTACCSQDSPGVQLYMNCHVGVLPTSCTTDETCPMSDKYSSQNKLLWRSGEGMGGVKCSGDNKKIKYCCDASNEKKTFSDCQWYNYGPGPSSGTFCRNNCPSDRVRVALDGTFDECNGGAKANCCVPDFYSVTEKRNEEVDYLEDGMIEWLKDPKCPNSASVHARGEAAAAAGAAASAVQRRDIDHAIGQRQVETACMYVLLYAGAYLVPYSQIWDKHIGAKWTDLKVEKFRDVARKSKEFSYLGPYEVCHDVVCRPNVWSDRARNGGTMTIDCTGSYCTAPGEDCASHDDAIGGGGGVALRRTVSLSMEQRLDVLAKLQKRGAPRDFHPDPWNPERSDHYPFTVTLPGYNSPSNWETDHPIFDEMIDYVAFDDCGNPQVRGGYSTPNGHWYHIEHSFDGNVITHFYEDAAGGILRSDLPARAPAVPIRWFREVDQEDFSEATGAPPLPGGADHRRLFNRVMECMGSITNDASFSGVFEDINSAKGRLAMGEDNLSRDKWKEKCTDYDNADYVLKKIRAAIAVIRYLNMRDAPNPNARLATVINNIEAQLRHAQNRWNRAHPHPDDDRVYIADYWQEWTLDYYPWLIAHVRTFCVDLIAEMVKWWATRTGEEGTRVNQHLQRLHWEVTHNLQVRTDGFR